MNRFIFICHAREDEDAEVAAAWARQLATYGLKVLFRQIAPWLPSETPNGLLREAIQTGLRECCYGVILFSHNFFARNWPTHELAETESFVVNGFERLIHVYSGIDRSFVARLSPVSIR
jgi:hypothetical protein